MRILWSSNAAWANTGYGNQTKLFLNRIKDLGHDVAGHFWYGLEGGALNWNGIPVYPKARDGYGSDIVGAHANHWRADIVITLIDAWVLSRKSYPPHIKWCPWFPIDMEPIPPPVLDRVRDAYQPLVYSKFGQRMAENAGIDPLYVPHGIDTKQYRPTNKGSARDALGWPQDIFIAAMVAANKGFPSRKNFPEQLEAFARLARKHNDVFLYLHTNSGAAGDGNGGVNLPELAQHLGIADRVGFPDAYALALGLNDDYMTNVYNAADVLLSVSAGEGFGIPIVEAQACGLPVITGDWTAMSELTFGGWKVARKDAEPLWTPLAANQFKPRIGAIYEALQDAYNQPTKRKRFSEQARKGAQAYDADLVTEQYWKPALDAIAARLEGEGATYHDALTRELAKVAA